MLDEEPPLLGKRLLEALELLRQGFAVDGFKDGNLGERNGFSVSHAGDVNGDGRHDFITGTPGDTLQKGIGEVAVVNGLLDTDPEGARQLLADARDKVRASVGELRTIGSTYTLREITFKD